MCELLTRWNVATSYLGEPVMDDDVWWMFRVLQHVIIDIVYLI